MLYYIRIILYCVVLYYVILYYIALCYVMLYYIILCCVVLCYVILYCVVLYYIILYYIILYYIILYYIRSLSPTCFGHTCGHSQGGALQRIYYRNFLKQYTNVKYIVLKWMNVIHFPCNFPVHTNFHFQFVSETWSSE